MGDQYIITLLAIMFIGVPLYIAWVLLSKKNKGTWDEESRLKGEMRSRKWRVKDTADDIQDHLFRNKLPTELWPVPVGSPGVQAISHERHDPAWRAITFVRPSVGSKLLFTVEMPQQSDGSEADFAEAIVVREGEGFDVRTPGDDFPEYLTDDVRTLLETWKNAEAFHFIGPNVTMVFDTELPDPNIIQRLETYEQGADLLAKVMPRDVWR